MILNANFLVRIAQIMLCIFSQTHIGCGHTWDLTLVKGFNRGKTDVKKLYYSKTPDGFPKEMCHSNDEPEDR